jgi:multidrug efflux pump subunit AcrB
MPKSRWRIIERLIHTYGGMDPAQMEGFLVNYYEYHFLYITGIEHVESKSIQGVALIKLQAQ